MSGMRKCHFLHTTKFCRRPDNSAVFPSYCALVKLPWMNDFLDWFQTADIFSLSLVSLSLAIAATLVSYLLMRIALRFAVGRMKKIAEQTTNRIDDTVVEVLGGSNRWLMLLAALLIGLGMLDLNDRWNARVGQLWFVAVALQLGLWLTRAIGIGLRRYQERHSTDGMTQAGASATLMSWALRTVLWTVVLLAVLSNVGVNITAFVASLGVGGIAVALAVQNILGDLFASLSIAVDKPFEVGDFIGIDSFVGTVQFIGLKTTRIRSLNGEQIIIRPAQAGGEKLQAHGRAAHCLQVRRDLPHHARAGRGDSGNCQAAGRNHRHAAF